MARPLFRKFRHKLLATFSLLILFIILPVITFVNSAIDRASEKRVTESLRTAQNVFESFLETRREAYSERASTLIMTHPTLRALVGTSADSEELLFSQKSRDLAATSHRRREEVNEGIYSTVESSEFYRGSGVFLLTDARGKLLFSKANPRALGDSLSRIPVVAAALGGKESRTLWGSEDSDLAGLPLVPRAGTPTIYEVFITPITFDRRVAGTLAVGFPISTSEIARIREITLSDIAFHSKGTRYVNSGDIPLPESSGKDRSRFDRFRHAKEEFIALRSDLLDSRGEAVGTSVIYRSKTKEAAAFEHLKTILNVVVLLAALGGTLLSIPISRGVTKSIEGLIRGTEAVRAGKLDTRVSVASQDEFAALAIAFNEMTSGLREKEQIKSTFKRYVSPRVVNALLAAGTAPRLGGELRNLTVYFADIVDFTRLAENLTPEETVSFLNEYLGEVTSIVEACDGIVDKYIGDAFMAYWVETGDGREERALACQAACRHRRLVERLREKWSGRKGLSRFDVRIGLNSGEAILGNIGSDSRMDFTLIGDDVNAAARLQAANKAFGSSVLVAESVTVGLQSRYLFRELDLVRVQGKTKAVSIFELLGAYPEVDEAERERAELFSAARKLYQEKDFREASKAFHELELRHPQDRPAQHFAERCRELEAHPPAADWDGIHQLLEK